MQDGEKLELVVIAAFPALRSKTQSEPGSLTCLEGQLAVGIIIFVVPIPFFSFAELRQAIPKEEFDALVFHRNTQL